MAKPKDEKPKPKKGLTEKQKKEAVKRAFADGAADRDEAEGPQSAISKIVKKNMKGL
ncbi:MAG TPA: hypothetical protein VGH72_33695 [Pseudonocardia sp.]|jgi:hypothetical protein